jgi:hypothetical protein
VSLTEQSGHLAKSTSQTIFDNAGGRGARIASKEIYYEEKHQNVFHISLSFMPQFLTGASIR